MVTIATRARVKLEGLSPISRFHFRFPFLSPLKLEGLSPLKLEGLSPIPGPHSGSYRADWKVRPHLPISSTFS